MEILLDTHALLWFLDADKRLSPKAKQLIEDEHNRCFVSVVSLWEFTIKKSLKKIDTDLTPEKIFNTIGDYDYTFLPINVKHLTELSKLKFHHRDPFDRIIIAQAKSENVHIITKDEHFLKYPVKTIW